MYGRSDEKDLGAYEQLGQNLVGPGKDEALPTSSGTPMMEVVAPANMAEGFELQVQIGADTYMVKVPTGGVSEGEKFAVPMPDTVAAVSTPGAAPTQNVPVGAWKDGILACFNNGPCHNHMLMGFCCSLVAVGQLMTRLKLDHLANEGSRTETTGAFHKLFIAFVLYMVVYMMLFLIPLSDDYYDDPADAPTYDRVLDFLRGTVHYIYVFVTMYYTWKVRRHVRAKYAIPERPILPPGGEDIFCSVCLTPCTIMQMMRHTADYRTYRSTCCTSTGLPDNVPDLA